MRLPIGLEYSGHSKYNVPASSINPALRGHWSATIGENRLSAWLPTSIVYMDSSLHDGIYCTPYEADYFAHPELVVGLPDWPREGHQPTARVFHDVCTEHTEQICILICTSMPFFPKGFCA